MAVAAGLAEVAVAVVVLVFNLSVRSFPSPFGFPMFTFSPRLRPMTLLFAGALLVPVSAFAQSAPAIVPSANSVAVPVASAPASSPLPVIAPSAAPIVDTLTFRDIDVTELLAIISNQYNVPLVVSSDVSAKISYINISNKTPDQAIGSVVRATGGLLQVLHDPDGTYFVSKRSALDAQSQAIQPTQNTNAAFGISSSASSGYSALPPLGGQAWGGAGRTELSEVSRDHDDELKVVSTEENQAKKTYEMRLRNISPSLMAFWLDPSNHEMPDELRSLNSNYKRRPLVAGIIGANSGGQNSGNFSSGNSNQGVTLDRLSNNPYLSQSDGTEVRSNAQFGGGGGGGGGRNGGTGGNGGRGGAGGRNGGGVFQLPAGVDRIVAVDPQNALLVFGTPEGVAQLRDTIAFLDRPLRQVEIEAQFVSIQTTDVSAFGIDFTTARGNFNANTAGFQSGSPSAATPGIQVGFVRGNFQTSLTALQASSRAKVLSAPRITAINNLPASLRQSIQTPIQLTNTVTNSNLGGNNTNTNTNVFYISTDISLDVTPTINNDDTVTVRLQPNVSQQNPTNLSSGAPGIVQQTLDTIANVRDGETIALGGLKSKINSLSGSRVPLLGDIPLIGKLFRKRGLNENETELIIFLTARIIRRAGDSNFVAGT